MHSVSTIFSRASYHLISITVWIRKDFPPVFVADEYWSAVHAIAYLRTCFHGFQGHLTMFDCSQT
jgi:hypothetical protein